ncbi:6-hydroxynicotinate 3-monooxygenase-like protein [Tanacetum coccineum]
MEMNKVGKAVIVGGSIAGICSAHALLSAGWEVVVVEKTTSPLVESPTVWSLNQATDAEKKASRMLTRDENFNFRAAYWSDLHRLLYMPYTSANIAPGEMCDLLVAADGCLSSIRQTFLPDLKLRFYVLGLLCMERGVGSIHDEKSDFLCGPKKDYPILGNCPIL